MIEAPGLSGLSGEHTLYWVAPRVLWYEGVLGEGPLDFRTVEEATAFWFAFVLP